MLAAAGYRQAAFRRAAARYFATRCRSVFVRAERHRSIAGMTSAAHDAEEKMCLADSRYHHAIDAAAKLRRRIVRERVCAPRPLLLAFHFAAPHTPSPPLYHTDAHLYL